MALQDGTYIIYNTASDGIIAIKPELHSILSKHCYDLSWLSRIHPSFFKTLLEKRMIVGKEIDEYEEVVLALKKKMNSNETIHITINPTLDCNLRCWYCYEDRVENSSMDIRTFEATKKFINRCITDSETHHLVFSFFGGEPLLYYRKIVRPLIEHTRSLAIQTGKTVDFYMTTNGLELTKQVLLDIKKMGTTIDFQIALDGGREMHELYAVSLNFPVTLRCNYTACNIGSFVQVAEDFKKEASNPGLSISFHKVWQQEESADMRKVLNDVKTVFYGYGYKLNDSRGQKGLCYADIKNSIVINYDGTVYKCTARKFNDETIIGHLNEDGSISYNDHFQRIIDCKYKAYACRECIIFPICMQTCSQNVLEASDPDACVADNSNETIDTIIRTRLRNITSFNF